jgi:PBP1b-binding outer membrane lipoprotein LpoB
MNRRHHTLRLVIIGLCALLLSACGGDPKPSSSTSPNLDALTSNNEFTEAVALLSLKHEIDAVDSLNLINQYSQMTGLFDASAMVNSSFVDVELEPYTGKRVTVGRAVELLSDRFDLSSSQVVAFIIEYKTLQKNYCEVEYEYDLEGFIDSEAR